MEISIENAYGFPGETGCWGGYDTKSNVEIKCGAFSVRSYFYSSTGEFFELYENLTKANELLKGEVHFKNYEGNLEFKLQYDVNGHVIVSGSFRDTNNGYYDTQLEFSFNSDQSYITSTLLELGTIVNKYGGMKGIK